MHSADCGMPLLLWLSGLVVLALGTSVARMEATPSSQFSPCPETANCVSSDARDVLHRVPAFDLAADADLVWAGVRSAVQEMPRVRIVTLTDSHLHAECLSVLFRFVDDLELELRAEGRQIAVRSASRTGSWDLGVNRRRVERLRATLRYQRLIR